MPKQAKVLRDFHYKKGFSAGETLTQLFEGEPYRNLKGYKIDADIVENNGDIFELNFAKVENIMKKYRLKIPFYDRGVQYEVGDLFAFNYDCYKADESTKCLNKDFVESNPDIFELIEEPKEEVIEGYCFSSRLQGQDYVFCKDAFYKTDIPATLILNPKKQEEIKLTNEGMERLVHLIVDYSAKSKINAEEELRRLATRKIKIIING